MAAVEKKKSSVLLLLRDVCVCEISHNAAAHHHKKPSQQLRPQELPAHPAQVVSAQALCLGQRFHLVCLPLRMPSLMSTTRHPIRAGTLDQLGEQLQQNMEQQLPEWVHLTEATQTACSCHVSKACQENRCQGCGKQW